MFSFPFNIACLHGVGSNRRERNNVIHGLPAKRQLRRKGCLRKQDNLFVWPQLCDPWPVLIFRGGYVWHLCPQVEQNVKKKKKSLSLWIFFHIIEDSLKFFEMCVKSSLSSRARILLLCRRNKDFPEISSLLRIWMLLGLHCSEKTSWRNVELRSHLAAGPLSHRL